MAWWDFLFQYPSMETKQKVHDILTKPPSQELKETINSYIFEPPSYEIKLGITQKLENFITETLIQSFLKLFLHTPDIIKEIPTVINLYEFFLKAIAIFTLAGIVYFGVMQIIGKGNRHQSAEYIIKIVQSLIIMNIVIRALPLAIEFVNKLVASVLSLGGTQAEMIEALMPNYGFGLIIFTLVFALILINLIWFYFIRIISIVFLIGTAPIFFFLWLFPKYQNMQQIWLDELIENLQAPIIHAIIMVIWLGLNSTIAKADNGLLYNVMLSIACGSFMLRAPSYVQRFLNRGHSAPNPIQFYREIKYGLDPRRLIGLRGMRFGGAMMRRGALTLPRRFR